MSDNKSNILIIKMCPTDKWLLAKVEVALFNIEVLFNEWNP